jgi:hypothetical protein
MFLKNLNMKEFSGKKEQKLLKLSVTKYDKLVTYLQNVCEGVLSNSDTETAE